MIRLIQNKKNHTHLQFIILFLLSIFLIFSGCVVSQTKHETVRDQVYELERKIGKTCRGLPESCNPFPKECEKYLIPTTYKDLKTDYSRTETDELGTKYLTQYARITFHDDVDESSARAVIIRLVDELPATVAAYYPGLSYILDVGTDSLETLRAKLEFIRNFDPSIKYVSNIPLDKL